MCLYEVRLTRVQYVQQVFPELSMREITNGEDYDYQLVLHICSIIVHFFTVNVVVWWSSIHLLWLVFVTYWLTWCLVCCLMLLFAVKLSKTCLNFIFGVFNYCFYSAGCFRCLSCLKFTDWVIDICEFRYSKTDLLKQDYFTNKRCKRGEKERWSNNCSFNTLFNDIWRNSVFKWSLVEPKTITQK